MNKGFAILHLGWVLLISGTFGFFLNGFSSPSSISDLVAWGNLLVALAVIFSVCFSPTGLYPHKPWSFSRDRTNFGLSVVASLLYAISVVVYNFTPSVGINGEALRGGVLLIALTTVLGLWFRGRELMGLILGVFSLASFLFLLSPSPTSDLVSLVLSLFVVVVGLPVGLIRKKVTTS